MKLSYMLETPKALNTLITRKNFKDITMDNQQETKIYLNI